MCVVCSVYAFVDVVKILSIAVWGPIKASYKDFLWFCLNLDPDCLKPSNFQVRKTPTHEGITYIYYHTSTRAIATVSLERLQKFSMRMLSSRTSGLSQLSEKTSMSNATDSPSTRSSFGTRLCLFRCIILSWLERLSRELRVVSVRLSTELGPGFDSISPLNRIKWINQDIKIIKLSRSKSCLVNDAFSMWHCTRRPGCLIFR